MTGARSITVVIPALNEIDTIAAAVRSVPREHLAADGWAVEVLVVDNGSVDGTGDAAAAAGARVVREERRGYGRAYKTGLSAASGSVIATIDADLSLPAEEIPNLLARLERDQLDFITTNRFAFLKREDWTVTQLFGNWLLSLAFRMIYRLPVNDSQCGMWVFRRSILDNLRLTSDGMAFSEEIKIEACYYARLRWAEAPIPFRPRAGGEAKLSPIKDGIRNIAYLVRKRLQR